MRALIPNHSFPLGWTNLKWGLRGQLYHSPGLHPFLQFFLTTACSINCIPAHSVTVLSSLGNKKRCLHSFHIPALTSGSVHVFLRFLTVLCLFALKAFSAKLRVEKRERSGVWHTRRLALSARTVTKSHFRVEIEVEKTY